MTLIRRGGTMIAAVALAGLTLAAHAGDRLVDEAPDQEQSTLTGCLRVGSAPSVLLLRGAMDPRPIEAPDADQMPRDYLLVAIPEALEMAGHLNHLVAITGYVNDARSGPPPPEAANTAERALRRLSVSSLQHVADTCSQRPVLAAS